MTRTNRYLVGQRLKGRIVPRCDLPGSPYISRIVAKRAASRNGIYPYVITTIRRSHAAAG
jgi:hypothetical protein